MKKVNQKNKRLFRGLQKAKRSINVEGKWKAVELDPSLFAEEGMEGLVCFEELTNYRMLDSEQASEAEKEPKKNKVKKRKSTEKQDTVLKEDVESKEADETEEPPKKKAKKKNKLKTKKLEKKESDHLDSTSATETQGDFARDEAAWDKQAAHEEIIKCGKSTSSDPETFTKSSKKSKKRKNQKQQTVKDTVTESSKHESHSERQVVKKEKFTRDKMPKPVKKQQQKKNWTEAVLDCCNDRKTDVSAWKDLFVPTPVLKALSSLGFGSPTAIQALTLPSAIRDHMDILGAAETGKRNDFPLL